MTNTLYVGPVLGHRLDGRPIYGVSGGAEGDGTTGDAPVVGAGTDVGGGTATPPVVPWTPPASQADLDKIVADRLARQKAQFGDYETFKAAATELQAIKDGQKSELQKAQDLVQCLSISWRLDRGRRGRGGPWPGSRRRWRSR